MHMHKEVEVRLQNQLYFRQLLPFLRVEVNNINDIYENKVNINEKIVCLRKC